MLAVPPVPILEDQMRQCAIGEPLVDPIQLLDRGPASAAGLRIELLDAHASSRPGGHGLASLRYLFG